MKRKTHFISTDYYFKIYIIQLSTMVCHNSAGWWSSNAVQFNWCGAQFESQVGHCLF